MTGLSMQSSDDANWNSIEALRREAQYAMHSPNVSCVQDFFTHEVFHSPSLVLPKAGSLVMASLCMC